MAGEGLVAEVVIHLHGRRDLKDIAIQDDAIQDAVRPGALGIAIEADGIVLLPGDRKRQQQGGQQQANAFMERDVHVVIIC